jgi:hypothetical protein
MNSKKSKYTLPIALGAAALEHLSEEYRGSDLFEVGDLAPCSEPNFFLLAAYRRLVCPLLPADSGLVCPAPTYHFPRNVRRPCLTEDLDPIRRLFACVAASSILDQSLGPNLCLENLDPVRLFCQTGILDLYRPRIRPPYHRQDKALRSEGTIQMACRDRQVQVAHPYVGRHFYPTLCVQSHNLVLHVSASPANPDPGMPDLPAFRDRIRVHVHRHDRDRHHLVRQKPGCSKPSPPAQKRSLF